MCCMTADIFAGRMALSIQIDYSMLSEVTPKYVEIFTDITASFPTDVKDGTSTNSLVDYMS